jgi:hypothetical protein
MGNSLSSIWVSTTFYKNTIDKEITNTNKYDNDNDYDIVYETKDDRNDIDINMLDNEINNTKKYDNNDNVIDIDTQISTYIRNNNIYNYTTNKIIINLIKNNNNNINYIDKVLQRYPSIMKNLENINTFQIMYDEVFY